MVGGIPAVELPRSIDVALYAERVSVPVLMVNGREDFLVPQQTASSGHALIEVYPGIVKRGRKKTDRAIRSVEQHIPPQLVPGSDQYDAAICAILAATFAGKGPELGLPDLTGPESGYDPREGWIYGLPADFVRREAEE